MRQWLYLVLTALSTALLMLACNNPKPITEVLIYESRSLKVFEIEPGLWRHESYIPFEGKDFPCNGLVLIENQQAYIFDTPVYDSVAQELLHILDLKSVSVKGVVVHHFHNDCLGGLKVFEEARIPSYGLKQTRVLAKEHNMPIPSIGFEDSLKLKLHNNSVQIYYPGAGHSPDNIVTYFPQYQLLFGGCLIKEMGAGKGYLGDADTLTWPQSVRRVQRQFPEARWVVPGHGAIGDTSLLGYTRELFL